jgi:hypothetical protein
MKSKSSIATSCPPSLTRRVSLAAISLAAAVLVTIGPVFAQTDDGFVAVRSTEHQGIPVTPNQADNPGAFTRPSRADHARARAPKEAFKPPLPQMDERFNRRVDRGLVEPWDVIPPSLADPALARAPKESVEPTLPQINEPLMPRVNGDLVEPWDDPKIPYLQPMMVSRPNSIGMPGDGLPYPLR